MGFGKMLELLKKKEKDKIVIAGVGTFYILIGNDAILLNKELNLKLICMEKGVCKVGFSIKSLDKYTKLIEEKNYSYIVYL